MNRIRTYIPLLLAFVAALPLGARADEGYGTCKGFIDSLPATIATQGVWCLRADLATAITAGAAITLAANNVTLDCNGHAVDGLGGGAGSNAVGIRADGRLNAVVRGCEVRGFRIGVRLDGAGQLVEENRVEGALLTGVHVEGDGLLVRANFVGNMVQPDITGIYARGDGARVVDNDVRGINTDWAWKAIGIHIEDGTAEGNRIGQVESMEGGAGIELVRAVASGNILTNVPNGEPPAIRGDGEDKSICRDNLVYGNFWPITGCAASGNLVQP